MKEIDSSRMREIQIEMLKEIHAYCLTNGIRYSLYAGSLLGAVRHKGFIPWDDDIDICMPRSDYNQFVSNFRSRFCFVCSTGDKLYPYTFAKVIANGTHMIENTTYKFDKLGVFIDVFPLDTICNDRKIKYVRFLKKIHTAKTIPNSKNRSLCKCAIISILRILLSPIQIDKLALKIDRISENRSKCKNDKIAQLVWGFFEHVEINKDEFDDLITVSFESIQANAFKNFDYLLRGWYGDYMELPPVEKRINKHDFKAYIS